MGLQSGLQTAVLGSRSAERTGDIMQASKPKPTLSS